MSQTNQVPKIGFVSLGCPKNLVDSERILTELRTEGYQVVPTYNDADLVIVNTCGFIDSAVQESLEAIGETLDENGKVIVTGCLGAKENQIREVHLKYSKSQGLIVTNKFYLIFTIMCQNLITTRFSALFLNRCKINASSLRVFKKSLKVVITVVRSASFHQCEAI